LLWGLGVPHLLQLSPEKIQRYLERAEHQISVQNRLTSDLIDVSRIRAGKLELQMQPCDLGQIVREIVENQRQVTGLHWPAQ
jgi:signal transduction histidine kinase